LSYPWSAGRTLDRARNNFEPDPPAAFALDEVEDPQNPHRVRGAAQDNFFLILRGTQTVTEWTRNFGINLGPHLLPDFGRIHAGFLDTYKLIRGAAIEALGVMGPERSSMSRGTVSGRR